MWNFVRLIVDKPERHLHKGSGFHMDIVIISYLNILCGLIGAPFVCVATVRSVSHVSALTIMSTDHAPGEKPYIKEVKGTCFIQCHKIFNTYYLILPKIKVLKTLDTLIQNFTSLISLTSYKYKSLLIRSKIYSF